ncbi:MAG: lectin like domain-containing protein [Bacteroidales bacterium]
MRHLLVFLFGAIFGVSSLSQETENSFPVFDFDRDLNVSDSLPLFFDLRNSGRISPVKTQANGGCWASAVMGSVESVWRTFDYGNFELSDRNLKQFHGFDPSLSNNGSHYMATAYFSRRDGPLMKSPQSDSTDIPEPETVAYITDARYLPNEPDVVKQTIMDLGAVYSMMYYRRSDLDTNSNIYYASKEKINHAVNLIGWNDTLNTNIGRGAWIAQNSLGKSFGEKGFFYIPYADNNVLNYNAIWPKWIPFEPYSKIFYYDTLGSYKSYGFGDSICYGLIKFTAQREGYLTKIGTAINNPNTRIKGVVFRELDNGQKILKDSLSGFNEIICKYAGYYTIDLEGSVELKKNSDFYILIKYNTPSDTIPLPIETFIKGYSEPHIVSGKCWVNPNYDKWPNTWYECGAKTEWEALKFDLCIKAYFEWANE